MLRGGWIALSAVAALLLAPARPASASSPPAEGEDLRSPKDVGHRGDSPAPALTIVLRYDDWCAFAACPKAKAAVDLKVLELAERYGVPLTVAVTPAFPERTSTAEDRTKNGSRTTTRTTTSTTGEGSDDGPEYPPERAADAATRYAGIRPGDPMVEALLRATRTGLVEAALHGLHHTTRVPRGRTAFPTSELAGLPAAEQETLLAQGVALLTAAGLPGSRTLVPPWNAYDEATLRACAANGLTVLSADLQAEAPRSAGGVRLAPATAVVGQLGRLDRLLALAAERKDREAVVVVMMHAYDFEEYPSAWGRPMTTLNGFETLLERLSRNPQVRLASLGQIGAEQGASLSAERLQAAKTFESRMRFLNGVRIVPYRFIPDFTHLLAYWSLPTYRALNRRAVLLVAATYAALAVGGCLVGAVGVRVARRRPALLAVGLLVAAGAFAAYAFTRPVGGAGCFGAILAGLALPLLLRAARRRAIPDFRSSISDCRSRELSKRGSEGAGDEHGLGFAIGNRQSEIGNPLLLGLALAALALLFEFLWFARMPAARVPQGQMGFVVNRLHLAVLLSRGQTAAFALASAAAATVGLGLAFVLARRGISDFRSPISDCRPRELPEPGSGAPIGNRQSAIGNPLRLVLALAVVLVCAVPFHHAVSWAAGGLFWDAISGLSATQGAQWSLTQFFRDTALLGVPQLFWLGAALALGGWLLVTRRRWPDGGLSRALAGIERLPRWVPVGAAALATTALAAAFALGMFRGLPHQCDATMYYFQAKTLAAGRLTSPVLGGREFFDPACCPRPGSASYAFVGDRWFGVGQPGAPLLYAAGLLLGVPWVIAPLLGGCVVVATYFLARGVFGRGAALAAVPLVALSPWLIFMSGEYLSHVPGAVVLTLFLVAALRAMERASWPAAAAAGFLLGYAANIRPPTALAFALPTAIAWLVWLVRRRARAWRPTLAFAVALAIPMAALLAYNAGTTGHALTFAPEVAWRDWKPQGADRPAVEIWRWRPEMGVANLAEMAWSLSSVMLRWPIPALGLILAVGGVLGFGSPPAGSETRGRVSREGRLALLLGFTALMPALGYARWFHVSTAMNGPRYIFETVPVLAVLGAGALVALGRRLLAARLAPERVRATLAVILVLCFGYAAARTLCEDLRLYHNYYGVDVRMFDEVNAEAERPALVFVPVPPSPAMTCKFYAAIAQNDPALAGPLLYARDLGPENWRLAAALPGRHTYRWDHAGSRLAALAAEDLAPREHGGRPLE